MSDPLSSCARQDPPAGRRVGSGVIHSLQVSDGGAPKHAVRAAQVGPEGLAGDRQRDRRHHGGAQRAVCLLALEVIERLRAEGHPIGPGSTGENVTIAGLDWSEVRPGRRLLFAGGVELLITGWALPCATIRAAFADGDVARLHHERAPASSRVYTSVIRGGRLIQGELVELCESTG